MVNYVVYRVLIIMVRMVITEMIYFILYCIFIFIFLNYFMQFPNCFFFLIKVYIPVKMNCNML